MKHTLSGGMPGPRLQETFAFKIEFGTNFHLINDITYLHLPGTVYIWVCSFGKKYLLYSNYAYIIVTVLQSGQVAISLL